jgi:hypothetical protein
MSKDVKTGRILAVDDNEDILFALKLLLKQHVEVIDTLTNRSRFRLPCRECSTMLFFWT